MPQARLIAFYLPQFHPIPENDEWWGRGFTEWTNVTKAKPLFASHHQPNLPADLGFYDLRVPEARMAQAEMARTYGIEGFMYWHYWFGNGRRILERPFNEVLRRGEPDFPFCLGWANQSWTGIWHGAVDRVLIQQTYPGEADYTAHFYAVLDAFGDARYITVEGKPLFIVFIPGDLPEPRRFTDLWRELAHKAGLNGLYLVGSPQAHWQTWDPVRNGFDAAILINMQPAFSAVYKYARTFIDPLFVRISKKGFNAWFRERMKRPRVIRYERAVDLSIRDLTTHFTQYPCVMPNWDNTPRSGLNGVVFHDSNPELFRGHLRAALRQVEHRDPEHRIVFVKSWNEWAEGNYLEPDQRFGRAYLDVVKQEVMP